jgi:cell division protein FtsB
MSLDLAVALVKRMQTALYVSDVVELAYLIAEVQAEVSCLHAEIKALRAENRNLKAEKVKALIAETEFVTDVLQVLE